MRSPLDFGNSDRYRKELTLRNLTPYKKSPFGNTPPFYYEVSPLNVFNVKDSPDNLIDSSNFFGIKKGIRLVGNDDLKSSNAAQHLVVVDQGAIYLLPSISKRWTPSDLKVERSPRII